MLSGAELAFRDTQTYDYYLHISPERCAGGKMYHGAIEQLIQLCSEQVTGGNGKYNIKVTDYDLEDLHRIEQCLVRHGIEGTLEVVLREHND